MNVAARPRLVIVATLVFLAGLMTFDQPGLCPCWLIADVHDIHPHPDGHPERPHSHGYLFDLFLSGLPAVAEPALVPAATLILALALAARWHTPGVLNYFPQSWATPPEPPPPR
jgi:hypothetical protein